MGMVGYSTFHVRGKAPANFRLGSPAGPACVAGLPSLRLAGALHRRKMRESAVPLRQAHIPSEAPIICAQFVLLNAHSADIWARLQRGVNSLFK